MPYLTTFQLSGTSSGKTSQDGPHPYFLYSKICCPVCWSLCNCCFCVLSPNHHNAHKDGHSRTPLAFFILHKPMKVYRGLSKVIRVLVHLSSLSFYLIVVCLEETRHLLGEGLHVSMWVLTFRKY